MKRVFRFLLVLLLVASLMPVQAMAETTGAHSITVEVEGGVGGTASANFQTANAGDTVTITCYPESDYELKKITGNGPDGSFQIYPYDDEFTMPDGDVTVTVKFGLIGDGDDEYEGGGSSAYVIYAYVIGGVPLQQAPVYVTPGSSYQFVPYGDYEIDRVEAKDGRTQAPVNVSNSWCVEVPANGLTAYIYLKESGNSGGGNEGGDGDSNPQPSEYNITVTMPENGIVSGVPDKAKKDDVITVTTTPAEDYELDEITVTCNGQSIDVDEDGKFTMPEGEVTVTVTFKAVQVLPSGLSFSYAYDVQRSPTYPKKGANFEVSGFAKPYGPSGSQLDSNEGPWVLSSVGKYSSNKNLSRNLSGIVTGIAGEYGVPADDLPIHKLIRCNNGQETTIAYGVLIMHNSSDQVAFFIGDSLNGSGAGYFFSKEAQSGTKCYDVPKDVTDEVKPSAEHTTNPKSNAYKANIDMADQSVIDMLVTPDDLAGGQNVRVYMEVKEISTSAVPNTDHAAITGKAGNNKIATFLDIKLLKQIGNEEPQQIVNTKDNLVPITLKLTDDVIPSGAAKDSFYIIYHHVEDGSAVTEEIPATFNVSSKILSFKASKFSTYALAYKPAGTLDKVVKSGDIAGINDMTMLLLCCAVVLAGVAVYDKKRAR